MFGVKAYARSCGILGSGKDGDCIQQESGSLGEAFVCFCTSDKCNHASTIFDGSSCFSAMAILWLYKLFAHLT